MQLLYPLLVYSYLKTVQEKQGMHARDLLSALKARFLQSESTSASVVKELDDLSAIVHHQHLQSNAAKEVRLLVWSSLVVDVPVRICTFMSSQDLHPT